MNKQAFIYIGISASGKSTEAEKHAKELTNTEIINRDDIRRGMLEERLKRKLNIAELWEKWKFNKTNEDKVTDTVNEKINKAALENKNIISSDTNLNKERRNSLKHKLEQLGYVVEFKFFDVDFDKAVKWDLYRADSVGKDVIYEQYMRYQEDKVIKQDENLPECIIVDIDGTCAHMENRRGPFEWDKVDQDSPDEEVFHIIKDNWVRGRDIIFLSGRDSCCYDKTFDWLTLYFDYLLSHNRLPNRDKSWSHKYKLDNKYFKLYMRKEGDMRKDSIVKEELFNEHIRDKYNVKLVLDDRPSVCRSVWLKLKLKLLTCGNPYIEF
jgi:predicted kinase